MNHLQSESFDENLQSSDLHLSVALTVIVPVNQVLRPCHLVPRVDRDSDSQNNFILIGTSTWSCLSDQYTLTPDVEKLFAVKLRDGEELEEYKKSRARDCPW